jgi:hypothetical protein
MSLLQPTIMAVACSHYIPSFPLFITHILEKRLMVMLFSHDTFNFDTNHVRRGKSGSDYAKYLFGGWFLRRRFLVFIGQASK